MAAAKKEAPATTATGGEFDWKSVLDAAYGGEVSTDDMKRLGGLVPIYASELAHEENWPPLVGLLVGVTTLEFKKETKPEQRWRDFYVIECELETKAIDGVGENRDVIDRKKGDYCLMPKSGALKNVLELDVAAGDTQYVHRVAFRVKGDRIDIGRPKGQEMWPIESHIIAKPIPRTGKHAQMPTRRRPAEMGVGGTGQVVDAQGQPVGSIVGGNATA